MCEIVKISFSSSSEDPLLLFRISVLRVRVIFALVRCPGAIFSVLPKGRCGCGGGLNLDGSKRDCILFCFLGVLDGDVFLEFENFNVLALETGKC